MIVGMVIGASLKGVLKAIAALVDQFCVLSQF